MHIRDALVLATVAACAHNPDPRVRTIEQVQRDGYGGWIVIHRRGGSPLEGELLEARRDGVAILTRTIPPSLVFEPLSDVATAEVWTYSGDRPSLAWGTFGVLSTVSHGILLIASVPVWTMVTGSSAYVESRAPLIEYPKSSWVELAKWARFPQGLPRDATVNDLVPAMHGANPTTSVAALAAATRYAAEHGITLDPRALQRPAFDAAAHHWVFTWQQTPSTAVTIIVTESGQITVTPP